MGARERLDDLRAELQALQPGFQWTDVTKWAEKARTFVRTNFPTALDDFNRLIAQPPWEQSAFPDSYHNSDVLFRREARNRGISVTARDAILAFLDGLLSEVSSEQSAPEPMTRVLKILERFHYVALALLKRSHNRRPLKMADEYDVQYLLGALLRIEFNDVRPEEWTPSTAGASSRMDFLLKDERIVVETKRSRVSMTAKSLGDELFVDIARYKAHEDCGVLTCLVYDPEHHVSNPTAIEKDLSRVHDGLPVTVMIRPK